MTNFLAASRTVRAVGATYHGDPANLIDGDPNTTADVYLSAASQADWFTLDMGDSAPVGSVTLANVTATGLPLGVWITDAPDAEPNTHDPGYCAGPTPNPQGAGSAYVFTAPGGSYTGRYVQIRLLEIGGTAGSLVIGGASYALPASGVVLAPTLTATPQVAGAFPLSSYRGTDASPGNQPGVFPVEYTT